MVVRNPKTGMGGVGAVQTPGGFLYNWLPDWALAISCDNADPSRILRGSACDVYRRNQDAPFTLPPMPATPGVPVNLPANPVDAPSAQAAVDAVVADTIARQQADRGVWLGEVVGALDAADQAKANQATINTALVLGAAFVFVYAMKR